MSRNAHNSGTRRSSEQVAGGESPHFTFSNRLTQLTGLLLVLSFGSSRGAETFSASSSVPRARVLIVQDLAATDAFNPRVDKIRSMVSRAITNLTAKPTVREAWRSLVSTQDVVGIKVVSAPGARSGTRPAVVMAVVEGLLSAGLPPKRIIVWDKQISDLQDAGFPELAKKYGDVDSGSFVNGILANIHRRLLSGGFDVSGSGDVVSPATGRGAGAAES